MIEMQRLEPGMMARYEIDEHRPTRVNAIQFGMGEAMLGTVDRLIDKSGLDLGIVCVEADRAGGAARLSKQSGLYTVLLRGYEGEEAVRREEVVQCILRAETPETLEGLASDPALELCLVDDNPEAKALHRRFCELRQAAGLDALPALCLNGGDGMPMLADSLTFRAEADEAVMVCKEMNYLDEMLHLGEPFARLTIQAPPEFRERFPLDRAPGITFADPEAYALEAALRRRVFDMGLFLMAAPGWLNGCDTLNDCMKHERLRQFVGRAFTDELMPAAASISREALEKRVIESFTRYENPLSRSRILRCCGGLLSFIAGEVAPVMRAWADERFEPPRAMAFALAATIMLYAGARFDEKTGRWQVARGHKLEAISGDPEKLRIFSTLAHDMPPETLAYAALADRELWNGRDLRDIDGLEARVALDIAAMQREPGYLPEA